MVKMYRTEDEYPKINDYCSLDDEDGRIEEEQASNENIRDIPNV